MLAAVALAPATSAHAAQTIDIGGYTNADIQTYSGGLNYPVGGSTIQIGGVDFLLSTLDGTAGTTGVIQTPFGSSSFDVALNGAMANTAYVIINSSFGLLPLQNGELWFSDTNGNQVKFDLIEGFNVRDHFFNNVFIQDVTSPNLIGTAVYGNNIVRLDAYRYTLPTNFGPLLNVSFRGVDANGATGQPFLAAITLDNVRTGAVPEPATWMMMLFGFGVIGGAMRYRRRSTRVSFAM